MSKNKIIIVLGLLVAVMPFLGFPGAWKTFFITGSGLLIALLSFLILAKKFTILKSSKPSSQTSNKISTMSTPHIEGVRTGE